MIQSLTDGDNKALKALEDQLNSDREKYQKEIKELRSEISTVYHYIERKVIFIKNIKN